MPRREFAEPIEWPTPEQAETQDYFEIDSEIIDGGWGIRKQGNRWQIDMDIHQNVAIMWWYYDTFEEAIAHVQRFERMLREHESIFIEMFDIK